MSDSRKADRLWTPYFLLIIAIMFFSYVSFHGTNSGTSVYVELMGSGTQLAGILASIYSITAAVARLLVGPVIDERGRSLVMRIGSASFVLGALIIGFIQADWTLIVGRVLQGIGFGALTTSASAAAADVLPLSRMGEGLAYYSMGNALAQSVGPALALSLVVLDPPEIMYFAFATVNIIVFVLSAFCNYEKHPKSLPITSGFRVRMEKAEDEKAEDEKANPSACTEDAGEKKAHPEKLKGLARFYEPHALSGAMPMMFMSGSNCFSVFFAALYGLSLGVGNGGIFFTFSAVSMVAVRLGSKLYMDRVLPIISYTISAVLGLLGLTCMLLAPQLNWLFYVAGFLYGASLGMTLPINQTVAIKNTPDDRWGVGSALFFLLGDIAVATCTIVYGVLIDSFGFTSAIFFSMSLIVVAFIMVLIFYPPWAKSKKANEEWKRKHEYVAKSVAGDGNVVDTDNGSEIDKVVESNDATDINNKTEEEHIAEELLRNSAVAPGEDE